MTTFRVRHQKRFTTIANEAIRDKSISLKARGLHHLLLSYPDDWKINEKHLVANASDSDGRDAIRGAIKELVDAGYIRKAQTRNTGGQFGQVDYDIFETPQIDSPQSPRDKGFQPQTENPSTGNPTADGKPVDGKSADGKPVDGKSVDILNTDSTKDLKRLNTDFTKESEQQQEKKSLSLKERLSSDERAETGMPIADLDELLCVVAELCSTNMIESILQQEIRLSVLLPWLHPKTRAVDENFASFVGKAINKAQPMTIRNAQKYVSRSLKEVDILQVVVGYWRDYQASLQRRSQMTQVTRKQVASSGHQTSQTQSTQTQQTQSIAQYRAMLARMTPAQEREYLECSKRLPNLKRRRDELLDVRRSLDMFGRILHGQKRPNLKGKARFDYMQTFNLDDYREQAEQMRVEKLSEVEQQLRETCSKLQALQQIAAVAA